MRHSQLLNRISPMSDISNPARLLRYFCHCGLVFFGLIPALVLSEPYLPEHDEQVLETLPVDVFARDSQLSQLRSQLASRPDDVNLATTLASHYIKLGDETGDPRYFGHAQAALQPWWEEQSPNAAVLLLRAKLHEKQHDYDRALADLHTLLASQPNNAQAWVNTSNIYRVQGKYDEALEACASVYRLRGEIPALICSTPIQGVTGHARESYESLQRILPRLRIQSPSLAHWTLTTMAEIAVALGWNDEAEAHFREAYIQDATDLYLLRDYADFLLDHDQPNEALEVVKDNTNDEGILLLAAIAAKMVGNAELAKQYSSLLKARFDEIYLRGGAPHGRYESRYELVFANNPQRALELAQATWQQQKETRDTRNLLEAALQANEPGAAEPAIEFLKSNKAEDVVLQNLVNQLTREQGQ